MLMVLPPRGWNLLQPLFLFPHQRLRIRKLYLTVRSFHQERFANWKMRNYSSIDIHLKFQHTLHIVQSYFSPMLYNALVFIHSELSLLDGSISVDSYYLLVYVNWFIITIGSHIVRKNMKNCLFNFYILKAYCGMYVMNNIMYVCS